MGALILFFIKEEGIVHEVTTSGNTDSLQVTDENIYAMSPISKSKENSRSLQAISSYTDANNITVLSYPQCQSSPCLKNDDDQYFCGQRRIGQCQDEKIDQHFNNVKSDINYIDLFLTKQSLQKIDKSSKTGRSTLVELNSSITTISKTSQRTSDENSTLSHDVMATANKKTLHSAYEFRARTSISYSETTK